MKKLLFTIAAFFAITTMANAQSTAATNTLTGTAPTPTQYLGSANGFDVTFKANGNEHMRISEATGFVGIGGIPTTPLARLEVYDSASAGGHLLLRQAYSGSQFRLDRNTNAGEFYDTWQNNGVANFSLFYNPTVTTPYLSFNSSSLQNIIQMTKTGNIGFAGPATFSATATFTSTVGIGTATPGYALDVQSSNANLFSLSSTTSGGDGYFVRNVNATATSGAFVDYWNNNGTNDFWLQYIQNSGNPFLSFNTGPHPLLTIAKNGNIGMGINLAISGNNPNGYKLAVDGTIGAKAIIVETATTPWPDYVFEKDYKLKSIKELEAFITKNKHLPNVPSACEVEKNGIDMATMDATLLAKIEELSLYIIEQNKRMEQQNKRIEMLEACQQQ